MASNHYGGPIVLTEAFIPLSDLNVAMASITIRAAIGIHVVRFGRPGGVQTGFLLSGEAHTFPNVSAKDVLVAGSDGDIVYWSGTGG